MKLADELNRQSIERKAIVTGYMSELVNAYTIIDAYETIYGDDSSTYPNGVYNEIMELVERSTEIHQHLPALRESFENEKLFKNVDSEIDDLLA